MQELVYTALVPHPPIMIPAVGGDEVRHVARTREAMAQVARELLARRPEALVIIGPHGPVFQDAIALERRPRVTGDLGDFQAPQIRFDLPVATELAELVVRQARNAHVMVAEITEDMAGEWEAARLDHGTMVPLHFLQEAGLDCPVLPITMGLLPWERLYGFGQALQTAIDQYGRRVAVLASGDLSHRLTPEAPAGYEPEAGLFDRQVVDALSAGDLEALFRIDRKLTETAGECGMRPILMLAGVLDGLHATPRVISYEGPFGVGYAVVSLEPGPPDPARRLLPRLQELRRQQVAQRRSQEHPIVQLARASVEHFTRTGLEVDFSAGAPHEGTASPFLQGLQGLPDRAGVFVSLKIDGILRGCMGTTTPTQPSLALEVVKSAVDACSQDPRFPAVEEEELDDLEYSVDVLGLPEAVSGMEQLDPERFGVIVEKQDRRGLLLPRLEGITSPGQQVAIACQKAGIEPGEPGVTLLRFEVNRFR